MDKNENFEKLEEFRKDITGLWDNFKKYLVKSKDSLIEYHGHSWNHFGKNLMATGGSALMLAYPLYSFVETVLPKLIHQGSDFLPFFPDMGSEKSFWLRLAVAPFIVAGGYLSDKGRKEIRKKNKNGSAGHKDGSFMTKFNSSVNIIPYTFRFGGDVLKAGIQTIISSPIVYTIGRIEGFTTDLFKYAFLNYEPSERIPEKLKKAPRWANAGLASLMIGISISGTYVNYRYSDYLASQKEITKKEIKLNNLEKSSLDNYFPEFKKNSLASYILPADGVKVDTPKYFSKN